MFLSSIPRFLPIPIERFPLMSHIILPGKRDSGATFMGGIRMIIKVQRYFHYRPVSLVDL